MNTHWHNRSQPHPVSMSVSNFVVTLLAAAARQWRGATDRQLDSVSTSADPSDAETKSRKENFFWKVPVARGLTEKSVKLLLISEAKLCQLTVLRYEWRLNNGGWLRCNKWQIKKPHIKFLFSAINIMMIPILIFYTFQMYLKGIKYLSDTSNVFLIIIPIILIIIYQYRFTFLLLQSMARKISCFYFGKPCYD